MAHSEMRNIASVDQIDDSVIVEFNNDVTAVYSADLLRSILPQAEIAIGNPDLDEADAGTQDHSEPEEPSDTAPAR